MTAAAVIVAGGSGERLGREGGKQLAMLSGRPVLARTVEVAAAADAVDVVVVVCHPDRVGEYRDAVESALDPGKPTIFVAGGGTRQESVAAGLAWVAPEFEFVIVHDGARPLATPGIFDSVIDAIERGGSDCVAVGYPSADTLKFVNGGVVEVTPDRARLWAVQTPQAFRTDVLREAHHAAARDGFSGTDDASLVERLGGRVSLVEGPRDNIKVTVPEDLAIAEAVLAYRAEGR